MMGFSSSLCSYHCHYHQLDDFRNLRCCQKSFIIVAVTKGGPKRCALWTLLSASLSSVVIVIIIARLDITVMVDWAESTKLLTYLPLLSLLPNIGLRYVIVVKIAKLTASGVYFVIVITVTKRTVSETSIVIIVIIITIITRRVLGICNCYLCYKTDSLKSSLKNPVLLLSL